MLIALRKLVFALLLPALLLSMARSRTPSPSLWVYDFELGLGPAGNVDHLASLGFEGVVTRVAFPSDLPKLREYARRVAKTSGFGLLAYVNYDFTNPSSPQVWRDALPILARLDGPLWVIVRNAPKPEDLHALLTQMATEAQVAGVEVILYPHWNTDIESAAEASTLIRRLAHPNLSNSIHTCHEIRGGNQNTLPAVVAAHARDSSLVTLAGADPNAYAGPFVPGIGWDDAIKPLDKGNFTLLPFLQALHDSHYDGPVILHTFGITNDPGHLQRSLRKYDDYLQQLAP